MRARSEERLEMIHGIEIERDETQRFKNLENRKNIKLKSKWPKIFIRISLYYLLSTGLFVFCYYYAYVDFGDLLHNKPTVVNVSGLRTFSTDSAFFWLQELNYLNSEISYIYEVPADQFISNPTQEITNALNMLAVAEESLAYGEYSAIGKNQQHETYLLSNFCLTDNCLILAQGLHSAVLLYISDMLFLESQILQGINVNLDSILSKKNELAYGEKVLFDLYDSFMTSEIQQNIQTVI